MKEVVGTFLGKWNLMFETRGGLPIFEAKNRAKAIHDGDVPLHRYTGYIHCKNLGLCNFDEHNMYHTSCHFDCKQKSRFMSQAFTSFDKLMFSPYKINGAQQYSRPFLIQI